MLEVPGERMKTTTDQYSGFEDAPGRRDEIRISNRHIQLLEGGRND